jgi:hypothetical protein
MLAIFVLASVEIFVFLVQANPTREVSVRGLPRERLTLAPVRKPSEPGKMGEDDARQGNAEMSRQVRPRVHDLSREVHLDSPHVLNSGEGQRHETGQFQVCTLYMLRLEQAHS